MKEPDVVLDASVSAARRRRQGRSSSRALHLDPGSAQQEPRQHENAAEEQRIETLDSEGFGIGKRHLLAAVLVVG
jgi:hypothetical protein